MAWYAELKRRKWYCINQWDAITWYQHHLYETWYNSLTEEQKQKLVEIKQKEKEQRNRETQAALMRLAALTDIMGRFVSNHDKYHGVYDENGFPKI